ncbi:GNAT family N-acetyltransferase [Streptomyces griseoviridis]|uniref:GNAT family N-acetyltransferase n=1 Tax=Streptomyces griseoviridis TaxID=45398 RepID=A0A3S9ZJB8_STRGD|nr:GNAT family N-acetyltransferase [Streptomyces griseoviridis]AZS87877.1 GNAT family N-acetyltransferase [Streptomyces griseoviridis]QCN85276.1 GNAT family N-acetyltransferase [Streptomyces griseoviridis]
MIDLTIRSATSDDVSALLDFWESAAEETSISDDEAGVSRLIARDAEAVVIAERAGRMVGTVIAGSDGWRCHLYRLAVDPRMRRQGVGSALLETAEHRFITLGGRRGDAMVLEDNELGQRAWHAAGYAPEPHWRRWTKPLV